MITFALSSDVKPFLFCEKIMTGVTVCLGGDSLCLSTSATGKGATIIAWAIAFALVLLALVTVWLIYNREVSTTESRL